MPVSTKQKQYGFLDAFLVLSGYCVATWNYTQGSYLTFGSFLTIGACVYAPLAALLFVDFLWLESRKYLYVGHMVSKDIMNTITQKVLILSD